jgi:hypothetical protein
MDILSIELYCKIATYIDESTWKNWIFVCRTFIAMLPKNCIPRRNFFTGYIKKNWLSLNKFGTDSDNQRAIDISKHLKKNHQNWTDDLYQYEIERYLEKIKHLERKREELKRNPDLQPALNPENISDVYLMNFCQNDPDINYYSLVDSFYWQPITISNLLNNIKAVNESSIITPNRSKYPYKINAEILTPATDNGHSIEMFYGIDTSQESKQCYSDCEDDCEKDGVCQNPRIFGYDLC